MVCWEEARKRAEQDHGDGDDVVWMKQNSRSRIYHDDPECSYLATDAIVEFTRQQAQHRGYGACKGCTLDNVETSKTGSLPTDLLETVRQTMADK